MHGWRSWRKQSLAALCGMSGAIGLGASNLYAEPLRPSVAPVPHLEVLTDGPAPTPYLGFVAQGAVRGATGLSGAQDLVAAYEALRAELAGTMATVGTTLIFGHVLSATPTAATPTATPAVNTLDQTPSSTPSGNPTAPPAAPPSPPNTPSGTPTDTTGGSSNTPTPPAPPPDGGSSPPPTVDNPQPVVSTPVLTSSGEGPNDPGPPAAQAPEPGTLLSALLGLGITLAYRRRARSD